MEIKTILLNGKLSQQLDAELLNTIEESETKDELINKLLLAVVASKQRLSTKEEIIDMFKIPKQRFEHLVRENKIPHIYINNKTRLFNAGEVYEYLNANFRAAS